MAKIRFKNKTPEWASLLLNNVFDDYKYAKPICFNWSTTRKDANGVSLKYDDTNELAIEVELNVNNPCEARWVILHEAAHVIFGFHLDHRKGFYTQALPFYLKYGLQEDYVLWRESIHPAVIWAAKSLEWDQEVIASIENQIKDFNTIRRFNNRVT